MPRDLWHLDPEGWPLKRIDTETGEHVPVFTGQPDEMPLLQSGGRQIACSFPKVRRGGDLRGRH